VLSGIKRETPANSLELPSSPQPHEPGNQMGYTFCKVCQVPCQSFSNYRKHIWGGKHRVKLQELKFKDLLEDQKQDDEVKTCQERWQRRWDSTAGILVQTV
jgi:hypothetical protein